MNDFYSRSFDANLIRVFLAIWETRNLTIAAERLGLTQPAISHALKRLRDRFDDPLFMRGPQGMAPTEAAARLHEPFHSALSIIGRAIHESQRFEPAKSTQTFRIAMSDVSEVYFLPKMLSWLEGAAPAVTIESVPLDAASVGGMMRLGEVDLAIGHIPQVEGECISEPLFSDSLVCLVRKDHPLAGKQISAEDFVKLRHIDASDHAPGHGMVDHQLAAFSLKRDIVMKVCHLITAPQLVRDTDLAVIYPESLALTVNRNAEFCMLPLPFSLPRVEVKVHVHQRMAKHVGISWLIDNVKNIFCK